MLMNSLMKNDWDDEDESKVVEEALSAFICYLGRRDYTGKAS